MRIQDSYMGTTPLFIRCTWTLLAIKHSFRKSGNVRNSKKPKILEGTYFDMVIFKKKQIAYFYDDETESTYMYMLKRNKFEVIMQGGLQLTQGKLFEKDFEEKNLYIKTGQNDLTIIFDILENPSFG